MNRFNSRLVKLEKGISEQSITALTEDGAPFRLRRQSVLPLALAAFRRRYAQLEGEPMPVSRFDERLEHLKRAGIASTSEPLLSIAVDILREDQEGGNHEE
jgi:hypothetical protein